MKFLSLLAFLLLPGMSYAQEFPALFIARDTRPDDTLGVYENPGAFGTAITAFLTDQNEIEVIAPDETGEWGWVNAPGGSGWVEMARLERQLQPGNNLVPRPLICFGNEPFWTLDIGTGPVAELGSVDDTTRRFFGLHAIVSENASGHYAVMGESRTAKMIALVQRQICSDGASGRIYGFGLDILVQGETETQFFTGCCSLTR